MFFVLFNCRHFDSVTYSPIVCESFLYCLCFDTVIQLYVAQYCGRFFFVLLLFRHCDSVIYTPILCDCFLYFSCFVTVIYLYLARYYVSGFLIVRGVFKI